MDKEKKRWLGIYGKYSVRRADGEDLPGRKHSRCNYFVLDLTHDPFAAPALRAYADACEKDGYGALAQELRCRAMALENAQAEP
jgi:hypothetical protein